MVKKGKRIYQFRITLEGIKPDIWRIIQVPESYSFWDLHVAIQDSMGWEDYHLHQFILINPQTQNEDIIGIPSDEVWENEMPTLPGWDVKIADYFTLQNLQAKYEYDFGDGWEHDVILEEVINAETEVKYPRCIDGKRSCPPEDCGGVWGYEELILIFKDKRHKDYKDKFLWLGRKFNAEDFHPELVKFDNPKIRWKKAFQDPIGF